MKHHLEKAKQIRCLILDLDGVLTDGGIYLDENKKEIRRFNIQDGWYQIITSHWYRSCHYHRQ